MSKETEDASMLKFNADFQSEDCVPLTLSEVARLLHERQERQTQLSRDEATVSMQFTNTLEYASRLALFENQQVLDNLKEALKDKGLHKYELVQLINLCPETIEEARALIPSLTRERIEEDVLEEVVQQIQAFRSFQ